MTLTVENTSTHIKPSLVEQKVSENALQTKKETQQTASPSGTNNVPNKDTVEISGKKKKEEYKDPLLRWPYRGLAFTNDIGAAVMDIAPNLGMGLWVPALMYFGADIYDKYKSDEKHYDPSTKRAFKQAVFQACASVIMPIVVVHNGQKAASYLAQNSKDGMSLQLKEEVEQFTVHHLKRRRLKDYEGNIEGYKKEFNEHLSTHLLDKERSHKTKNPLKILYRWIFSSTHDEKMTPEKLKKVQEYSNRNIDEMFEIREDLLKDKHPKKLSNKLMKLYDTTKREYAVDKNTIEGYIEDSIKTTLKQRQQDRLFHTKLWKTAGGFIALGASIRFIDKFVEKYVIEKVVEPGLDNFSGTNGDFSFGNLNKFVNANKTAEKN